MNPANPNTPLIPYLRQSRKKERTISIEEQRRDIRKWAKANGVKLAAEVVEQGVSGSKPWRERELGAAVAACERGEAQGIVVAWQDRLSRENGRATAEVWEALEAAEARLVCANEGLDTSTGDHELTFTIKAAIARDAWKRYKQNWERSSRNAIERGVHVSGRVPTGYRRREDKRLEPDPGTAPVIKELFERRAAGESWPTIIEWFNEQLPRPNGGSWERPTLASIIRRRVFLGEASRGDMVKASAHEALVSRQVWEAAQTPPPRPGREQNTHLLSRLLVCASCGMTMTPIAHKFRGKTYASYACRKKYAFGRCPEPTAISARIVEPYVEDRHFLAVLEQQSLGAKGAEARDGFEQALARVEAAEGELADFVSTDAVVSPKLWQQRAAILEQRVSDARQALARETRPSNADLKDLPKMWPSLDVDDKNAALAAFIRCIFVRRGKHVSDRIHVVPFGESVDLPSRADPRLRRFEFPDAIRPASAKVA